jgi:hypothetical protein
MALRLRLSSRDRRSAPDALCLIDTATDTVLSTHPNVGSADIAARVLNEAHQYARDLSTVALNEVVASTCDRLFNTRRYAELPPHSFKQLLTAVRVELRNRRY